LDPSTGPSTTPNLTSGYSLTADGSNEIVFASLITNYSGFEAPNSRNSTTGTFP
jgi:hypothetical protein